MEKRLTDFAVSIIELGKDLKNSFEARHLNEQIIRSSSSLALNFGELMGSESRKDFIHKCSIVLKELRETYIYLKIMEGATSHACPDKLKVVKKECNEHISILV